MAKKSSSFSSESGKWLWFIPILGSLFRKMAFPIKVFAVSDTKEIKNQFRNGPNSR